MLGVLLQDVVSVYLPSALRVESRIVCLRVRPSSISVSRYPGIARNLWDQVRPDIALIIVPI